MKRGHSKERKWLAYPYRLAHHPACSKFADHVYTIKGVKVCRGCFNLYLGMLEGLIIIPILVFVANFSYLKLFALLWVLFLPTPFSLLITDLRWLKDIFRQLLGIAIIASFTTMILGIIAFIANKELMGLIITIIVVAVYVSSSWLLSRLREDRNRAICMSCEEYENPRCEGLKDYYDRVVAYNSLNSGDAFADEEIT